VTQYTIQQKNRCEFELLLFLFLPAISEEVVVIFFPVDTVIRVSWTQNPERTRLPMYDDNRWADDLKFRTLIFTAVPFVYYFCRVSAGSLRTAVFPGLVEMHLPKRHFQAAESRLTCAWFTSPSVSHVMYVTTILFSTIFVHMYEIYISHILLCYYFLTMFIRYNDIYLCISVAVRRNAVASFFYSLTFRWPARWKIVLTKSILKWFIW